MSDETVFWGFKDDVELTHTEVDDAVREYLDSLMSPKMTREDWGQLPETLEVVAYQRMRPEENFHAERVLESLLEDWDEELGNPNGESTKTTDAMKAAAQEFVSKVLAEYEPWACEPTGETVEVDVMDWIQKNEPEWLEDK